ncbi:hypothetical protein [Aliiroseovarius sp. F20344]|uniref:hypothetical protein n=1 Tax=Aliiroseovarius sp. F20344 TaxID=2926414 RepID=UPI001FF13645|nr:hypothetical protein [Aliiroseovarius sp. F20344]MCK0142768.1 hypothetical protein [Aliiroseovarius sp. F20344]
MNTLINKITAAVSGAVLFVAAIAMAGLGFAVIGALAMFALIGIGIALIAAPFANLTRKGSDTLSDQDEKAAA